MHPEKLKEDAEGLIERAEILRWGEVNNKVLLDVGAGPLAIIAARDFNCTVTNIDVSEDALVEAKRDAEKEGLAGQIIFEHGDAASLRYPNGSFDVVICYGTLHHIEPGGRRKCLHELHRVAKEKVIIVEFMRGDPVSIIDARSVEFARGITNYSSAEITKVKGVQSKEIEQILGRKGYGYGEVVVYRGNLVLL